MNRAETAQLLAMMQTYDQRTVGETDVIAWHSAVGDLQFSECGTAVIGHYRDHTDRVMPANVREAVQAARRAAAGEERQAEIEARRPSHSQELVPMPDWFRATVEEHRRRARAARKQAEDAGEPVTFGSHISTALDGMRKQTGPSW